jgi:hypothetical protein
MNENDNAIIAKLHSEAIQKMKPKQSIRWESDGQGGGSYCRYTPGETCCWNCDEPIDENGECEEDCHGKG